jgi:hypothetical protein
MQSFIQQHKTLLVHLLFWCVYTSFFVYQIVSSRRADELTWVDITSDVSFHIFFMMALSYWHYFVALPRFLKDKDFKRYTLTFILPAIIFILYIILPVKQYLLDGFTMKEKWAYSSRFKLNLVLSSLFLVAFVGMLRFAEDWFKLEAQKREMENENLSAELRFLKAQINPHFLFNTLNNLYYLAYTQSPNTTEVIAKLSQMMRYMMYDSNHPRVPISKEIEYMQNYISLEKLRLSNEIPITFEIDGNTEGVTIAPLIFITFLENAFKHGVSSAQNNAWIKAHLHLNGKTCTYTVENSKIPETSKTLAEKSGIGLQNVKRRLDLSYPNDYTLNVDEQPDKYAVELKINLN